MRKLTRFDIILKLLPKDWQFYKHIENEPYRFSLDISFIFLNLTVVLSTVPKRKKR